MLTVTACNTSPPLAKNCSYDIVVRINRRVIWHGQVTDHNQDDGWPTLLRMVADASSKQANAALAGKEKP